MIFCVFVGVSSSCRPVIVHSVPMVLYLIFQLCLPPRMLFSVNPEFIQAAVNTFFQTMPSYFSAIQCILVSRPPMPTRSAFTGQYYPNGQAYTGPTAAPAPSGYSGGRSKCPNNVKHARITSQLYYLNVIDEKCLCDFLLDIYIYIF